MRSLGYGTRWGCNKSRQTGTGIKGSTDGGYDAVDQLQWGAHQLTRVLVKLQRLCVAFAAAVDKISVALLEPVHGKREHRAVARKTLQP